MRKETPAANPGAYVAVLGGWQARCVAQLRAAVRAGAAFDETVKWGHLVYFANGPAMLIRAEDKRVLLGFWRGRRLTELEPRIATGGRYEMGPIVLRERDAIEGETVQRLAAAARRLNLELGDPTARA
ncbi:DUF1801 domain-containing protein [Phenylobacterium sp.]|uniref:DUF1801 domain-containing protein n=1 Tax=Phenylobacterium sp. TaxID=1871053 RepID=UPI002730C21E|nr:DUF1801 domain-containing protein [Phenylobacterium sp.]MDP1598169.1 DUF1801 domain-containing protein [Phenylobacterium sp.]MDP3634784.1 DUF1801 domain-containing protein [Phenylobacterium sp.]